MKKTFRILIVLGLCVMFCALCMTSCEHSHKYGEWTVTKHATCTEDGERTRSCKCGETETQKIAAAHTPGAQATCVTPQNCTVCKRELVSARGHNYNHIEVKAPTCTEKGYTTYSCICGQFRTDGYVSALGHTPGEEATCVTSQSCMTCGKELQAAFGHSVWADVVLAEPIDNYTAQNDAVYPFSLQDGILISANHGNSTSSTYQLTAQRDFTLKVEYKVSSEARYDVLKILHNGNQLVNISGDQDWTAQSIELKAGDTVSFTYTKDSTGNKGGDCAYVKLLTDAFVTEEKQLVQATEEVLAGIQPSAEYHICCNGCGEILIRRVSAPSEGLLYLSNGDGTYTVAGIGTCEDEEVVIPSMHNGGRVTAIAEKAFYGCVSLTIIEIPAGVTAIGEDAFSACFGLEDIFVDRNNENYSSVDGVLFDKAQTDLISYPRSKTATQYTVPASVTKIRCRAFNACYDLTDIFVDENNAYYSSVGGVLFNKAQTELVCYPAGKSETRYTVPDGVTRIGDWAFDNCSALTEIELPSGMTSIGACAFLGCYGLKNITVPFGVEEIGDQAFFSCDVMECVTLPLSVKRIGYRAFDMCARLTEIRYGGTVAEWRSITFGAYWDAATPDYTVICTDGTAFKI